jgi:hypothetical protein
MTPPANPATIAVAPARGENLVLGILAGIVAAIIGAFIWMGITVATGLQVGYVALGIGALVGVAVRYAGNGASPVYGVVGAILTLLGCVGGQLLAAVELSKDAGQSFMDALTHVDFSVAVPQIMEHASPITYFIYAIGIYEGYKLSIRR